MSGLDYLKAIGTGDVPPPPIAALMDFRPVDVEEGRAVFAVTPAEFHYNPIGVVHGGLAATTTTCLLFSGNGAGNGNGERQPGQSR